MERVKLLVSIHEVTNNYASYIYFIFKFTGILLYFDNITFNL